MGRYSPRAFGFPDPLVSLYVEQEIWSNLVKVQESATQLSLGSPSSHHYATNWPVPQFDEKCEVNFLKVYRSTAMLSFFPVVDCHYEMMHIA